MGYRDATPRKKVAWLATETKVDPTRAERRAIQDATRRRWRVASDRSEEGIRRLGGKLCDGCGVPCDGSDARGIDQTWRVVVPRRMIDIFPHIYITAEVLKQTAVFSRLCDDCYTRYRGEDEPSR